MANHASAEKRHRQSLRRRTRNRMNKSNCRTLAKKTISLLETASLEDAKSALKAAERAIAKAAAKGIYDKGTAKRKISRLAKAVAKKTKK